MFEVTLLCVVCSSNQTEMCLQVRVENLTKERDMLRQAESRLSRDKEAMLAEQRNQNLLLTNIKSIQVSDHTVVFPCFERVVSD